MHVSKLEKVLGSSDETEVTSVSRMRIFLERLYFLMDMVTDTCGIECKNQQNGIGGSFINNSLETTV
jgi:hypothetical protein